MSEDDRIDSLIHALFLGAVRDGNYNTIHQLLGAGADPRDERVLIEAAAYGHAEIVELLLHAGADIHANNDSALSTAARNGHAKVVRTLVDAGADFSVHEHRPLRKAEELGHEEVARVLRDAGSYNPDVPGDSPGHRARDKLLRKLEP